jgi:hypothetical protein
MLIQVSDAPLGRIILRIASRYARRVQASLETTGHLFERRHHAILVDEDCYLLTVIRYIHRNPVKAALAARPIDYPWSSHHEYLGASRQPWVTTSFALRMLGSQPEAARAAYIELIDDPEELQWGTGPLQLHPENSQILGDNAFAARVTNGAARGTDLHSMQELLNEAGRIFNVPVDAIVSRSRRRVLCAARAWLAQEAITRRLATIGDIARRLGCTDTAIRRLIDRHKLKSA